MDNERCGTVIRKYTAVALLNTPLLLDIFCASSAPRFYGPTAGAPAALFLKLSYRLSSGLRLLPSRHAHTTKALSDLSLIFRTTSVEPDESAGLEASPTLASRGDVLGLLSDIVKDRTADRVSLCAWRGLEPRRATCTTRTTTKAMVDFMLDLIMKIIIIIILELLYNNIHINDCSIVYLVDFDLAK